MVIPGSKWTWSFLFVTIAQAAIGLALEAYVFGEYQTYLRGDVSNGGSSARTIPTYLSLFIFGFLFQILLTWDALRLKNTIQVIGLCMYNLGLTIYAAVQTTQIRDAVFALSNPEREQAQLRPFLIAVPCILGLGTILLSGIAWKLYDEFAWTIYKHISADVRMKRRYMAYQIYISLLKFDFFFFLSFTIQFLVVVTNTSLTEKILTGIAIPLSIIVLLLAGYWTRKEFFTGKVMVVVLYLAAMAYFLFKLVRMYDSSDPARVADYAPARRGLTLFAVITLLMLTSTIINAVWCMFNFGKGLKPHLQRRKVLSPEDKAYHSETSTAYNGGMPLGQVPTRMTID